MDAAKGNFKKRDKQLTPGAVKGRIIKLEADNEMMLVRIQKLEMFQLATASLSLDQGLPDGHPMKMEEGNRQAAEAFVGGTLEYWRRIL